MVRAIRGVIKSSRLTIFTSGHEIHPRLFGRKRERRITFLNLWIIWMTNLSEWRIYQLFLNLARKSLSEKRVFLQWKWYSSVYKTSLAWILSATVLRWLMEITVHELWKNLRYYCIKSTLIKWWALRIREKKDFSKFLRTTQFCY